VAPSTGTDVNGYLTEGPGASSFALADGVVYHTYSTYNRGLEFVMGYYPILDWCPKGATRAIWPRPGSGDTTTTSTAATTAAALTATLGLAVAS
jgi:hypothetical protein